MSRASKLAAALGASHLARHSANVAREKLQRVTDERDRLRSEVAALTEQRDNVMDKDLTAQALVEQEQEIERLTDALGKARAELVHVKDVMLREVGMSIVDMNVIAAVDGVLNQQEISMPVTGAAVEKGESK